MTEAEVLSGLQSGRRLRCDRRDEPLLPWLLAHPCIKNSGIVEIDEQSSYIEFWWQEKPDIKAILLEEISSDLQALGAKTIFNQPIFDMNAA